jgi:hypothetical protein
MKKTLAQILTEYTLRGMGMGSANMQAQRLQESIPYVEEHFESMISEMQNEIANCYEFSQPTEKKKELTHFVTIQHEYDGKPDHYVIWGIGETEEESKTDADRWITESSYNVRYSNLKTYPCTKAFYEAVGKHENINVSNITKEQLKLGGVDL